MEADDSDGDAGRPVEAEDHPDGENGEESGAQANTVKTPFAFQNCSNVQRKGSSAWQATCDICGKQASGHLSPPLRQCLLSFCESPCCLHIHGTQWTQLATTPHKMLYGHYLQKKGEHLGIFCVAPAKLERDYPQFMKEIKQRWEALHTKRTVKVVENAKSKKRERGLSGDVESEEDVVSRGGQSSTRTKGSAALSDGGSSRGISAPGGKQQLPYGFLSAGDKQRLRDECQSAWDLAFVLCGLRHPFCCRK